MNEMFSIDKIFEQIFPWQVGISWDLGTIIIALLFLSFLVLGFDYIKIMLVGRLSNNKYNKEADYYFDNAAQSLEDRNQFSKGSIDYEESNLLYKKYLDKSASSRIAARSYRG